MEFALQGRNLRGENGQTIKTSYEFTDVGFLDKNLRQEAWDKYQLILPLLDLHPRDRREETIRKCIEAYVAKQIQLIISGERTTPIFPQRSGKRKKKWTDSVEEVDTTLSSKGEIQDSTENGVQILANTLLQRISVREVQRWIQDFEESRRDIRSLVPAYYRRGRRPVPLPPKVEELLETAVKQVYETEERAPVTHVIDKLEFLILEANEKRLDDEPELVVPNKRKVYRHIDELDPMEIDAARMGRRYARRQHQQYKRGPRPTRPNARWEADDTVADLMVIDDVDGLPIGRPTFTAVRDKTSGCVPGFNVSFEPPSSHSVMECLFYAIPEKAHVKELFGLRNDYIGYGVPEVLAIDRGSGYLNKDLELACAQLGIELDPMPGKSPWLKGSIERFIKTSGTDVFHATPGTTFSNFLVRGDYDPSKHACVTLDGLWYLLHKWIVDVYTQEAHRGIGGVPAKIWERGLNRDFVPRLPASRNDLAVLLSRVESRVIQSTGIEFENLWYQDSRLSALRDYLKDGNRHLPVQFKYNAGDLSRIWVLDPRKMKYLEVLADDQYYTQELSLWKHRVIKRYAKEEMKRDINREALILAKEELHRAIYEEFRQGKKLGGRKRGARFLDIQVSEVLLRAQPSKVVAEEMPAVSLLIDLSTPNATRQDATPLASPTSEAESTTPTTSASSVAQIGVPLPPMIEGVKLPVDAELMLAGTRLTEPEDAKGEPETSPEKNDTNQQSEKSRVNTDPDEATTFGIKAHYGRRGPT